MKPVPRTTRRSINFSRGTAHRNWRKRNFAIGTELLFCDPQAPRQTSAAVPTAEFGYGFSDSVISTRLQSISSKRSVIRSTTRCANAAAGGSRKGLPRVNDAEDGTPPLPSQLAGRAGQHRCGLSRPPGQTKKRAARAARFPNLFEVKDAYAPAALATSAAKSSSFLSMPSPTSNRTKPESYTP